MDYWNTIEKIYTVQFTGSHLKTTRDNYPKIYEYLEYACQILDMSKIPDLYIQWGYEINACTIGAENPIIVLNSGLIDLCDDDEIFFIIGHELGHIKRTHMLHNVSGKFESNFLGLTVQTNRSVMLGSLSGTKLGVWVAHGEGRFSLPLSEDHYNIVLKYSYDDYPANPNGSDYSVAGICSADGRHLAMMPHPERAFFPWQCATYPANRKADEVTPWIEAFVNARKWVEEHRQ